MTRSDGKLLLRFSKDALASDNNKKKLIVALFLSIVKAGIAVLPPVFVMWILDTYIPSEKLDKVIVFSVLIVLATVTISLIDMLVEYVFGKVGKGIYISFQNKVLKNMFHMKGPDYAEMTAGDVLITLCQDIDSVRRILSSKMFDFLSDTIVAIAMFVFLVRIDFKLTLIAIFMLPILFLVQRLFQKICMNKASVLREVDGEMTSLIEDCVSNIKAYVVSGFDRYFFNKYREKSEDVTNKEIELDVTINANGGVISGIATLLSVFVLAYGGFKVASGTMTVGGLVAYNMYVQKLIAPVLQLTGLLTEVQILLVSIKKIYELIDKDVETVDSGSLEKKDIIKGKLEMNDIEFSYTGLQTVLSGVTAVFEPGHIYGIMGESGCGKSTLTNLIYRLWKINDNAIVWGGESINEYNIDYLRGNISMVGQDVHMLDDTVFNNIAIGDATITKKDVERIAKVVEADDFIRALEKQYDTMLGEKGTRLSGGQKQRIAIARALVRKTPLLILDEATSALDEKTEKRIMRNIIDEVSDRIVIIISHRVSALEYADEILYINDKRIDKYNAGK